MALFKSKNIITILKRALNLLDYRVVDHCERVAYIVLKMLECEGSDHARQERAIFTTLLHDIGAFKTHDIDSLAKTFYLSFEFKDTYKHASYGYLFLKNFDIGGEDVKAVLYHHTKYEDLLKTDLTPSAKDLAAKIFVADRADLLLGVADKCFNSNFLSEYRGTVFSPDAIDLLLKTQQRFDLCANLQSGEYLNEMLRFYDSITLNEVQIKNLLRAIASAIDFRSEYTVTHTITTIGISLQLAQYMGFNQEQLENIYFGALLHDMGKIATSILVLEKSEKLDDYEFKMMRDHVEVSEKILQGCVSDEILQIAIRHHEKLDGTGYPKGLTAEQLTPAERIVAVADILSALTSKRSYKEVFEKDVILDILQKQLHAGKLCPKVVRITLEHYDEIMAKTQENCKIILDNYKNIHNEYLKLLQKEGGYTYEH